MADEVSTFPPHQRKPPQLTPDRTAYTTPSWSLNASDSLPPTKDREQEYVTGGEKRSGGIQRFKLGLHGAKLDKVAMIGYIQDLDMQHWHKTINRWITEFSKGKSSDSCIWDKSERLGPLREDISKATATCTSVHERTGTAVSHRIGIQHLWIEMEN